MGDALNSFNKKMKGISERYQKFLRKKIQKQMNEENHNHEIVLAQNETTFKTALESENKKIESL